LLALYAEPVTFYSTASVPRLFFPSLRNIDLWSSTQLSIRLDLPPHKSFHLSEFVAFQV
jgi:hypothetical protein